MPRSMAPIKNIAESDLPNYDPCAFDAIHEPDGTFTLIPVRWTNQEEYNETMYGCGREPDYCDDNDPNNPVDMSADEWRDVYSRMDDPTDFIDHDHSMDY